MILLELFWAFFQVGLFAFGGGYAALPLIENEVLPKNWMTITEFQDIITVSQMTPGPIAVNCATFVGIRAAGIPGAVIATIGCILPSVLIALLLAYLYERFRTLALMQGVLATLRPAVIALIGSSAITLTVAAIRYKFADGTVNWNLAAIILFVLALVILRKWKLNPILVISGCGVVGAIVYAVLGIA